MSKTSPVYYRFPNGAETNQITGHLTGFGAQAAQYVIRSTRLDGNNKGETVEEQILDLEKAKVFIDFEIARLNQASNPFD